MKPTTDIPLILRTSTVPETIARLCASQITAMTRHFRVAVATSPGLSLDLPAAVSTFRIAMKRRPAPLHDLRSILQMTGLMAKLRPDIVHSVTPKAGLVSMIAGRLAGVKVRVHTFTGLVWPARHGLSRRILMLTDRLTAAMATHVVAESPGVARLLAAADIGRGKITMIADGSLCGVDSVRFFPSKLNRRTDNFNFLFVGRIGADKGVACMIEAFLIVLKSNPTITLTIVGPDENALDPIDGNIMRRAHECSSICFAGPTDTPEKFYAAADCVLLPSRREGMPNALLEAGAMALPVIATDIPGCRDIVIDGITGILTEVDNAVQLADAMAFMVENPDKRAAMGAEARRHVVAHWERNRVENALISFYSSLLA